MLMPLGDEASADPEPAEKIAEATKALTRRKAGVRGDPRHARGAGQGARRPAEAAAVPAEDEQAPGRAARPDRPGGQRARWPWASATRRPSADTEIRIRGEAEKLGPVVPRGFLSAFEVPDAAEGRTRSRAAGSNWPQWLTSAKNPLTPRVMVNRVWQHLFGQGLVTSVDNFGVTGDVPSHPELLDHLATRFVRDGWSVKKLVRAIVLSRAYRLGSEAPAANLAVDPANRLVWRHSPRRLDAEEIRDAMLAAAGTLDPTRPDGVARART